MFGFWAIVNILRTDFFKIFDISTTNADTIDCFIDFGAHSVCDATLLISIQSSLFLLVAQALLSRILTPGISIFVNSSVSSVKWRQPAYVVCLSSSSYEYDLTRCRFWELIRPV